MNPPPPPPPRPPTQLQLQGPRPTPLKVSKESVKIKKPPPHPHPRPNPFAHQQQHQPVVIYTVSPKVIHATVNEFMSIVQRLTGPSSSSSGDLSPAARLASIHKTSPKSSTSDHNNLIVMPSTSSKSNYDTTNAHDELMATILTNLEVQRGGEMGQFPGILSPAASALPPISSGFFSPAWQQEVLSSSPMFNWQGIGFNFTAASPSPSSSAALFSAPLVSPSPSSWDLFNNFLDRF